MVSVAIAGLVFVVAFGGALVGLWLRSILPKHQFEGVKGPTSNSDGAATLTLTLSLTDGAPGISFT
jgi:hypothetical protein